MQEPLAGLKVLEFGQIAAGPFAGSLLADLGADVVKVERPDGGDGMRLWPPVTHNGSGEGFSENFASVNRNKRSIIADLKSRTDVQRVRDLASAADVVIENFRAGVLRKLGLHYEALARINPRLVYCSISGYGQTGPYAERGAFDVTVQAASGVMSVTGEESGAPVKCGVPIADFCAGLYAAYTILAAIHRRNATGTGAFIDCSMLGSLIGVSALQTSEYFGTGKAPERLGSAHPRNAPYQAFRASDEYFVIAAGNDKLWQSVCDAVGAPELAADARFASQPLRARNQAALVALLQPLFEQRRAFEWLDEMNRRGVPCAPINDYAKILADPHVAAMGLVQPLTLPNGVQTRTTGYPVALSDFAFRVFRQPPELGAHTQEVYAEWLGGAARPAATSATTRGFHRGMEREESTPD
jgi:crotonobetainyl-CoA:carnitine CoA-transferase CaiB-like acyl-CoA transferase